MIDCKILVYRRLANVASETFVREQAARLGDAHVHYDLGEDANRVKARVRSMGQAAVYATGRLPPKLAAAVAAFQPDAALVHFGTNAVAVGPGLRRHGVPTFPIFHGHDATVSKAHGVYSDRRITNEIEQSALSFCVSNFIRQRLIERGAPEHKLVVHYTGIPLAPSPEPVAPLEQRSGVLFVGRLVEKKGVADLIRAYAALSPGLRDQHPLTIIGDGPLNGELRREVNLSSVAVDFRGTVDNRDVRTLMRTTRLLGLPSKIAGNGDAEGLGHVALEAQATGTPVVGYRSGGLTEAVIHGRTGLLCDEGSIELLAAALRELLADDSRWSEMSRAAVDHVRIGFDLDRNTAALRSTICEAIDG